MKMPIETLLIDRLARGMPRSGYQLNALHESDAELIRLPGNAYTLAIALDTIVEEIELGLYVDPYLIGWMAVTVNASDLAAVGAEPLGILLNETLPHDASDDLIEALQKGVRDACGEYALPVLGGDTNRAANLQVGGCALGLLRDHRPMTRIGCRPGDVLFTTGTAGLGNAYAFARLSQSARVPAYKPRARLAEGRVIREFASACMDSSDGILATLDHLARLNEVGFDINQPLSDFIHPHAVSLSQRHPLPLWMTLAGPHGDFELVFTVPQSHTESLMEATGNAGWAPHRLGVVTENPLAISIIENGHSKFPDTGRIRDLFSSFDGDLDRIIVQLHSE